jgi:hypothetical protein
MTELEEKQRRNRFTFYVVVLVICVVPEFLEWVSVGEFLMEALVGVGEI